jgi:predicted NBD/HSP70 family sugar kinase
MERRPAVKKISTVQAFGNEIFKEQKLTIGVDLGDRWSFYCVLDEAGEIILEQKVPTTPEAMKQTFGKIPQSLIAMETGTHSPWVSRLANPSDDDPGASRTGECANGLGERSPRVGEVLW